MTMSESPHAPRPEGEDIDLFAPPAPEPPPKRSLWRRLVDFLLRRKGDRRKRLTSTVYPLR
jgi:hypothetical protein